MRFDRILALSGLLAALSPLQLRAQAASGARCADGTRAESRYTACWFHGGVVVASTPPSKPRATEPTRSAKLRDPAPASRKARVDSRPHKAIPKKTAKTSAKPRSKPSARAARGSKPPKGATALCKDGSYTYNKNPKKGCKKHDGVARVFSQKSAKH
jgi:hypothetical protein